MLKKEFSLLIMKFRILYHEALKDKDIGCYNKAVSALWFSIENLMDVLRALEKMLEMELI